MLLVRRYPKDPARKQRVLFFGLPPPAGESPGSHRAAGRGGRLLGAPAGSAYCRRLRGLSRSLQGGEERLTKLGKGFFRDKYYEYLVHVPVIIRGRRRSGRNAGAGYERRDWLPPRGTRRTSRRSRWRSGSGSRWRPRWTRAAPSCSSRTRPTSLTLRGTGWSAPRARATGTPGRRWRRSCASA